MLRSDKPVNIIIFVLTRLLLCVGCLWLLAFVLSPGPRAVLRFDDILYTTLVYTQFKNQTKEMSSY